LSLTVNKVLEVCCIDMLLVWSYFFVCLWGAISFKMLKVWLKCVGGSIGCAWCNKHDRVEEVERNVWRRR